MFPFDFGFIPGTRAEDGDPLDLMILGEEPGIQGTVVTVRVIGVIEAQQTENGKTIRNDRLLGLADGEKIRAVARSIKELPDGLLAEIEHFFVAYNRFEGRRFVPLRRGGPNAAAKLIDRAQKSLRDSRRRVGWQSPRHSVDRMKRGEPPANRFNDRTVGLLEEWLALLPVARTRRR